MIRDADTSIATTDVPATIIDPSAHPLSLWNVCCVNTLVYRSATLSLVGTRLMVSREEKTASRTLKSRLAKCFVLFEAE